MRVPKEDRGLTNGLCSSIALSDLDFVTWACSSCNLCSGSLSGVSPTTRARYENRVEWSYGVSLHMYLQWGECPTSDAVESSCNWMSDVPYIWRGSDWFIELGKLVPGSLVDEYLKALEVRFLLDRRVAYADTLRVHGVTIRCVKAVSYLVNS